VKRVREITGGTGVPVVYDSIGKDTFAGSLDCLAVRGMMVSFGNSSGAVPPFEPGILSVKGSLYFTRPTLVSYTRNAKELQETADDLFAVIASGAVKIAVHQRFKLSEARKAHEALHSRNTTGATVLIP
jgi:NADPH2:quinone reductase